MALDPRIVKVSIQVDNQFDIFEGLSIYAEGMKFANANQNECEIRIYNLDRATRDAILTETSPFNLNRTPKTAIVEAGRVSYGTTMVYRGNIVSSLATQPPDIGVVLRCLTGGYLKGSLVSRFYSSQVPLSTLAQGVSNDLQMTLDFQATDKNIFNYNYSGSALKQVNALENLGGINAYIDDDVLTVKDIDLPISRVTKVLDLSSGMIGVPIITEQGLRVKYLLDNLTTLGGVLSVKSVINPPVNGNYVIYKLGFSISSRDVPFYYIAEAKRLA